MDEGFSLLGLNQELCEETLDEGETQEVKHFVFEDLLDSQEKLKCKRLKVNDLFSTFVYLLEKRKDSFFSREEVKTLGCYLGYAGGTLYTFEDFNFKINSLEEFTLLTEAVEVTTGTTFHFELCNLCQLPTQLSGELELLLSIYSNSVRQIPPLTHFDQIADENREVLKMAVKGNSKAYEKLERELGEEEAERLVREFKVRPEQLFDTCILSQEDNYNVVGVVISVKEVELKKRKLQSIDLFAEEFELTVLTPVERNFKEGERVALNGKMFALAAV
jgi:hypothetical protein